MKLKLAQRLLIGYYKTKLRTIGMVSPRRAAEAAFEIFLYPVRPVNHSQRSARRLFHKAEKLCFEAGWSIRSAVTALYTMPKANGKKILVRARFPELSPTNLKITSLALQKEGFRRDTPSMRPAHGSSGGKRINAYIYMRAHGSGRDAVWPVLRHDGPFAGRPGGFPGF
jgi:hypothetical protein